MSILSSLFGSKKRGKKVSSTANGSSSSTASSSPSTSKVRPPSPTTRSESSRFLSLRRRSSVGKPLEAALERRTSADLIRRKASPGKEKQWELPNLEFAGNEVDRAGSKSGLGLDDVGGVPSLSDAELYTLDRTKFGVDELCKAWKILGSVLKTTDQPGSILEQSPTENSQQRIYMCTLVLLASQSFTISSFSSVLSRFPTTDTENPGKLWSDRVLELARSSSPQTTSSTLKWALRRLQTSSGSPSPAPLISSQTYIQFVQAEHAASYPADAYHLILSTRLKPAVARLLHEIFDFWASLTAHADDQSGLGGKMALLMGWWILRPESGDGQTMTWQELYDGWSLAARRVEHLFLAWIRHQATTHTLPIRLSRLVEKYPYGESDYSAETLPSPPPSSFSRRTLHVSFQTDQIYNQVTLGPADILEAATTARPKGAGTGSIWLDMAGMSSADRGAETIVDESSASFLAKTQRATTFPGGSRISNTPISPAHRDSFAPLTRTTSNAKILDNLAEEVGQLANNHLISPPQQASTRRAPLPASESTWDDFTKSGFAEDRSSSLNFALTPSPSTTTVPALDRQTLPSRLNGIAESSTPPRKASFAPLAQYTIVEERVTDIDDMFVTFAEEGQLDPRTTTDWPPFVYLRLKTPYPNPDSPDTLPIERLLITVTYKPPPPPSPPKSTHEEAPPARSTSPTAESPFRFGSFGFKRSSSRPTFRSGFFGSSRSNSKNDIGADFLPGDDNETKRITLSKNTSRVSVDEMGALGRQSSSNDPSATPITPGTNASIKSPLGAPTVAPAPPLLAPVAVPTEPAIAESTTTELSIPEEVATDEMGIPEAGSTSNKHPAVPITPSTDTSISTPAAAPVIAPAQLILAPVAPSAEPTVTESTTSDPRVPAGTDNHIQSDHLAVPMGPSIGSLPDHWSYGAEGGAHVVFTYTGPSGIYTGRLLRIRKISTHRDDPLGDTSAIWRDDLLSRVVPADLLIKGEKVRLDRDWLGKLLAESETHRSTERRSAGSLEQLIGDAPAATLMENMRMSGESSESRKVLAVEIKVSRDSVTDGNQLMDQPKWGFLPDAANIHPPESVSIKSLIGRYTLHQHYRGATTARDIEYDPLDLFSADETRVTKALSGLWGIWRETEGKANSFRVFVDGKIVHPDERDINTTLLDITAPILIPLLRRSGCLSVLGNLQSRLDPIDISGIVALYRSANPEGPLFDEQFVPDITVNELDAFIGKFLADQSAGKDVNAWTLRERIIGYSLSAIFKDSSIIIRAVLSPKDGGGWKVEDESTVKLLDLDLKPLKMRHWAELDEKIWKHWHATKGDAARAAISASNGEVDRSTGEELSIQEDHGVPQAVPDITTLSQNTASAEKTVPGEFPGVPDLPLTPQVTVAPTPDPIMSLNPSDTATVHATSSTIAPHVDAEISTAESRDPNLKVDENAHDRLSVPLESIQSESALSTPLVPGAFKFPNMADASKVKEVVAQDKESRLS